MAVEVGLRSPLDAVESGPEEDAIDVELEDLVLAEGTLDPLGEHHLYQLAVCCFLVEIGEAVAGELHCDRARSLHRLLLLQIPDDGAGDALVVHTAMLIEARVFACEQGFDEEGRDLVQRHHHAVLTMQPADLPVLDVIDDGALPHLAELCQIIFRGHLAIDGEHDSSDRHRGKQEQQCKTEKDAP